MWGNRAPRYTPVAGAASCVSRLCVLCGSIGARCSRLCIDAVDLRLPLLRSLAVPVREHVPCSGKRAAEAAGIACTYGPAHLLVGRQKKGGADVATACMVPATATEMAV